MANKKLKAAIELGSTERVKRVAIYEELQKKQLQREEEERRPRIAALKRKMLKDDFIYKEVLKAVNQDKKEFILEGDRDLARAISEIPGLFANVYEDRGYGSDPGPTLEWVRVTWDGRDS